MRTAKENKYGTRMGFHLHEQSEIDLGSSLLLAFFANAKKVHHCVVGRNEVKVRSVLGPNWAFVRRNYFGLDGQTIRMFAAQSAHGVVIVSREQRVIVGAIQDTFVGKLFNERRRLLFLRFEVWAALFGVFCKRVVMSVFGMEVIVMKSVFAQEWVIAAAFGVGMMATFEESVVFGMMEEWVLVSFVESLFSSLQKNSQLNSTIIFYHKTNSIPNFLISRKKPFKRELNLRYFSNLTFFIIILF